MINLKCVIIPVKNPKLVAYMFDQRLDDLLGADTITRYEQAKMPNNVFLFVSQELLLCTNQQAAEIGTPSVSCGMKEDVVQYGISDYIKENTPFSIYN
ncbi:hypothetical protein CHS0354_016952 [Potamilus streckersoni]|uniref:Uncharacterized protein n=1 Tax=Potamilus streckersoni TaxID=2493646 RepID=A0AAE0S7E5_9BIVA|nr:hypothetical protein CHS0354_016952 [Potamilus streckersoni]